MLLFTGVELAIDFHCLYELVTDCDSLWARGLRTPPLPLFGKFTLYTRDYL